MGPLIPQEIIQPQWNFVIALLIGFGFGYALEGSGFSSSRKLAGVFYGYDFTVLRVFFTAAITAALGLMYLDHFGFIDMNLIYVNPTFIGSALIGGVIMGLGFITGGFCPGTSFCAAAIGKIDAIIFTLGMFIGIFIFSEIYPLIEKLYISGDMGPVTVYEVLGIPSSLFMLLLIIVALGMFVMAYYVQKRVGKVEY